MKLVWPWICNCWSWVHRSFIKLSSLLLYSFKFFHYKKLSKQQPAWPVSWSESLDWILIFFLGLLPLDLTVTQFKFFKVYLFILREGENESDRGAEREGERENLKRLHTVSAETNAGLEPTNYEIMSWAKIKSRTLNHLSPLGMPHPHRFIFITKLVEF